MSTTVVYLTATVYRCTELKNNERTVSFEIDEAREGVLDLLAPIIKDGCFTITTGNVKFKYLAQYYLRLFVTKDNFKAELTQKCLKEIAESNEQEKLIDKQCLEFVENVREKQEAFINKLFSICHGNGWLSKYVNGLKQVCKKTNRRLRIHNLLNQFKRSTPDKLAELVKRILAIWKN